MNATHASVVIVKPAGTRSAPSTRVISAMFAPLPPSRARMSREPSSKSRTHVVPAMALMALVDAADAGGVGLPAARERAQGGNGCGGEAQVERRSARERDGKLVGARHLVLQWLRSGGDMLRL